MSMFGGGDAQTTMKWVFIGVGFMLFASFLFPLFLGSNVNNPDEQYAEEADSVN